MAGSDPSPMPEVYLDGTAAYRLWRGMECKARGTLLVHGSKALAYVDGLGPALACDVLARMVAENVLKPCKVDLACADHSLKAFAGLQGTGRHIAQSPWCSAHALFWTYEPVNRTPMREYHP